MKIRLKLLSSLAKVLPKADPVEDSYQGSLSGFLNETISFQAAWKNVDTNCTDVVAERTASVKVTVDSPLGDAVHMRQVKYIPVRFTTFADADENYISKEPGLFPDILSEPAPLWRCFDTHWECAWIDVTPKEGTVPGVYPITVTVTPANGGEAVSRTQMVEILPAMLPEQELILTHWFHNDCLCHYYGVEMFSDEFFRIAENFLRLAVQRGMNMVLTPIHTPPLDTAVGGERMTAQLVDVTVTNGEYSFSFDNLEKWVAMCKRAGIKYYELAHLFTQWGAKYAPKIMATVDGEYKRIFGWDTPGTGKEYTSFLRKYVPAVLNKMKELGVDKQCWFHISDEPGLEMLEDYKAAKAAVADMLEGYNIMDALSSFEFYASGALTKPIPANNHIAPFIEHGVKGLWTYYCIGQYKDVSNMFVSMPSSRNRILGVQMYKYDIEGFLQWGFNFYNSQYSNYPINPYLITDGDGFAPAGDCYQVYPGANGMPEDSIRFMVKFLALQDMRAFKLLETLKGKDFVLELIDGELIEPVTFDKYPTSDAYILRLRERVNREIVKALQ